MRSAAAIIAANRFGLGARPDEMDAIEADPQGWLKRQLDRRDLPEALRGLPGGSERAAVFLEAQAARRAGGVEAVLRENGRRIYLEEAMARLGAAARSADPFRERLVAFWANHFTVSAVRPVVGLTAGAFEREAIRPHVAGRFADMLVAVARHPAMLFYLDNIASIGPGSAVGMRTRRGLNENFAREILELHTVGIAAAYSQDDVRALASMLTGWSLIRPGEEGTVGAFTFRERAHEPGGQTLLGQSFGSGNARQAESALRFLALHPATAQHVAAKLARHFVADDPPPAAVSSLARVFLDTDGDLGAIARALVELPAAWSELAPKIRTPFELQVAAFRALGEAPAGDRAVPSLAELGQPLFRAPSPAGWPDQGSDWIAPEAMVKRVQWAVAFAERVRPRERPTAILERALGPAAGEPTRLAVARAESVREALAMLFASPEFQRR